jgi:hypothetical protein
MADTLATTSDVDFLVQANTLRVYFAITCTSVDGEELSGWALQSRLQPASVVENSATSTGIFGG